MNDISIIIPNFNGMAFLPACIEALKKQTYTNFDVLLVDNASSDGSIEWIKKEIQEGTLSMRAIFLGENMGFAGGVNRGISHLKESCCYVILLNNDTEVFPDYVEKLYLSIQKSEYLFAVSPLMINAHKKELVDDAGDGFSLMGYAYQRCVGEDVSKIHGMKQVFSACAGAAMYRKEVLEHIGYFDPMHFAYLEDIDLSFRAKLAGYFILFNPEARVYHLGSATSGSKYNAFKVRLAARNNLYLLYKNFPNILLFIHAPAIFAGILLKAIFFYKKGFLNDYMQGVFEGIRSIHRCKRVNFSKVSIFRYLALEGEMIIGTIEYIGGFLKRRFDKKV